MQSWNGISLGSGSLTCSGPTGAQGVGHGIDQQDSGRYLGLHGTDQRGSGTGLGWFGTEQWGSGTGTVLVRPPSREVS